MRATFLVNNFNKGPWVYRAAASALAQTLPCDVVLSDAGSTDDSIEEIRRAVHEAPRGAAHEVRILEGPQGVCSFQSCSDHFDWLLPQIDSEWLIQCSSDDYSLPDRARICMEAVDANPCSAVATTQFFEGPDKPDRSAVSGFPRETGYLKPAQGLLNLGFGSVIAAYNMEFLRKAGPFGTSTPDVLWGWLAALDKGFYVVANPQHVHVNHAGIKDQLGFQGKMAAASGDEILRLAELNHFQLLSMYDACYQRAVELHPEGIPAEAHNACLNMVFGQAKGWLEARKVLHTKGVIPGVL